MNQPFQSIQQTKKWIEEVVIGFNFCPFAKKPFIENKINFFEESKADLQSALKKLIQVCMEMDGSNQIETCLIIFPDSFLLFQDYLQVVELSEKLLAVEGYEGVYQIASFHPLYQFAGTDINDPENYTNRSPYPMLHILRESSIEKALKNMEDPSAIPTRNIQFTQNAGVTFLKKRWNDCFLS